MIKKLILQNVLPDYSYVDTSTWSRGHIKATAFVDTHSNNLHITDSW